MAILSMVSGAQIRAARALIGLTAAELARMAGISLRTVQRFEAVDRIPEGRTALFRLIRALETQGITFQGDPVTAPGVRLVRKAGAVTKKGGGSQS